MPQQVIYEVDVGKHLNVCLEAKYKKLITDRKFKYPPNHSMVTINMSDVGSKEAANAHLSMVQNECWPVLKRGIDMILVPAVGQALERAGDNKKDVTVVEKEIGRFLKNMSPSIVNTCQNYFKDFAKDKSDYTISVVKGGLIILVNGGGLVASVAIVGAAGWTGAGTVVAIIGMARSVSGLIGQFKKMCTDVETDFAACRAKLEILDRQLKSGAEVKNTAKQLGKEMLNRVLSNQISGWTDTVSDLEKDIKTLEIKVKGLKVRMANLREKIAELLNKQVEIQEEVDRCKKEAEKLSKLAGRATSADRKKIEAYGKNTDKLNQLCGKVALLTRQVMHSHELFRHQVRDVENWVEEQAELVTDLTKRYNKTAVWIGSLATEAIVDLTLLVGMDFAKPKEAIQEMFTNSEKIGEGISASIDSLLALKDIGIAAVVD